MKRYIVMILAALMAVSIIGCGQSGDLFPESTAGDTAQTEPVDEAGMKVGYLLPSGTDTTDTDSRIEGIRQMQYETGLKDSQVFIRTDVSRDDCASRIEKLVQEGSMLNRLAALWGSAEYSRRNIFATAIIR